jgi:outer membrane immunogenic protein
VISVKFRLACIAALAATPFAAVAGDLPAAPPEPVAPPEAAAPYSWTGFYLGTAAGWAQTDTDYDIHVSKRGSKSHSSPSLVKNGISGSIFAGYNLQLSNNVVFGAETDLSFLLVGKERTAAGVNFITAHTNYVGSVRGRLGYAFDRVLLYSTGGLAFASPVTHIPTTAISVNSGDGTRLGWTVGGGAEYAFSGNWIAGIEYRHSEYETEDHSYKPAHPKNTRIRFSQDPTVNQVTARVSYKF